VGLGQGQHAHQGGAWRRLDVPETYYIAGTDEENGNGIAATIIIL
jgi:hypothetical protein